MGLLPSAQHCVNPLLRIADEAKSRRDPVDSVKSLKEV